MMALETERLILEKATHDDAEFVFRLLNSPSWIEHIGDRNIKDLKDAKAYIDSALINSYKKHGFGMLKMKLKKDGSSIGMCGLLQRTFLSDPDIGFAVLPDYERKGYTYEAASAVLQHANEVLGETNIHAFTSLTNAASQNLLLKLGMLFLERKWIDEYNEECMIYSQKLVKDGNV